MIKRIVKMSFHAQHISTFKSIFESNWKHIKHFEGCEHVELLQDENEPGVFFTYSLWHNQDALDKYRDSELFKRVWGSTKILFNAKPQAWSVKEVVFQE
jgi:quinol monooxygenase YgiN